MLQVELMWRGVRIVQVQGKEREKVAEAGKALGLDATYIPFSYIEQVTHCDFCCSHIMCLLSQPGRQTPQNATTWTPPAYPSPTSNRRALLSTH